MCFPCSLQIEYSFFALQLLLLLMMTAVHISTVQANCLVVAERVSVYVRERCSGDKQMEMINNEPVE